MAQHSKTLEEKQFGRITAHPGTCQAARWTLLPILLLIAPRPKEVLQKWPVRAGRGLDRCFESHALLQGEERH